MGYVLILKHKHSSTKSDFSKTIQHTETNTEEAFSLKHYLSISLRTPYLH